MAGKQAVLKDARGYPISVGDAVVCMKTGAGAGLLASRVVDLKTRVKIVLKSWKDEEYFSWVAPYSLMVVDGFPELEKGPDGEADAAGVVSQG